MSLSSDYSPSLTPSPKLYHDSHPHVPWLRQLLNFIGCLLIFPLYRAAAINTLWPATVDLLISISLAELCRFTNEGRRIAFREIGAQPRREKEDVEKGVGGLLGAQAGSSSSSPSMSSSSSSVGYDQDGAPVAEAMASIVGWREDPDLWERCLESYKAATGCRFVLCGIDGHDTDDKEMVDIFQKVRLSVVRNYYPRLRTLSISRAHSLPRPHAQHRGEPCQYIVTPEQVFLSKSSPTNNYNRNKKKKVYPQRSLIISLQEPLGEVANAIHAREIRTRQKLGAPVVEQEVNEVAMQACLAIARNQLAEHLERHDAHLGGPDGIKHLLIQQRHLHKKGIMFTAFVFSTIIADMLGLEFVWTSDCKFVTLLKMLVFFFLYFFFWHSVSYLFNVPFHGTRTVPSSHTMLYTTSPLARTLGEITIS